MNINEFHEDNSSLSLSLSLTDKQIILHLDYTFDIHFYVKLLVQPLRNYKHYVEDQWKTCHDEIYAFGLIFSS